MIGRASVRIRDTERRFIECDAAHENPPRVTIPQERDEGERVLVSVSLRHFLNGQQHCH
jgi:hypothetical protein